ncbi:MAG: hypothetical protein IPP33_10160 [Flavobacteriales bacterium]|nr:hypothetical protein [Flavobacteriales bacterium]
MKGEQPRALAVSPDGNTVYCAFFESGNQTTVISGNSFTDTICSPQGGCTNVINDVKKLTGPYGWRCSWFPNSGTGFNPPPEPERTRQRPHRIV